MTWGDEDWARQYREKHQNDLSFRLVQRIPERWLDRFLAAVLMLLIVNLIVLRWALGTMGL